MGLVALTWLVVKIIFAIALAIGGLYIAFRIITLPFRMLEARSWRRGQEHFNAIVAETDRRMAARMGSSQRMKP